MAFPSTTGTKRDDLQGAWQQARSLAAAIKTQTQNVRAQSAAGTLGASVLLAYLTEVADVRTQLLIDAAVPGIGAYAQSQINDATFDVSAAFTAMVNQLTSARDWIIANFPKDASGFLLAQTLAADGHQQDRVFTAAQTAGLRTTLDALLATID